MRIGTVVAQGEGELRARMRGMWASVAESWREHADYVDARSAAVTAKLLELSAPRPGERVLELACGAGGVGLAAAPLVAPGGEVVLSDLAAEMTAIASARAAARGLDNVRALELAIEQIDQPDDAYDVVLCREGLMFAVNKEQAAGEIRRVLRPGGRVALAVWGPRERNPWLSIIFDEVSALFGTPVPPPGVPGPFSLDDPEHLARLLVEAGLSDVTVTELPTPLRAASFDEWWTRTIALAGPLANRLAAIGEEETIIRLQAHVRAAVRPYETPTGLEFPGLNLVARARLT